MGRESSHGTKELFNLPPLVLKARHLSDSAFCTRFFRLEVPEQALGGIPLGLGLVVEDKPTDFSCIFDHSMLFIHCICNAVYLYLYCTHYM